MARWLWGDRPDQGKGCHVRTVMGRPARGLVGPLNESARDAPCAFVVARRGAGLAGRSADPAGLEGNPSPALEVYLDAVAVVVLDELSYRGAAWPG